MDKKHFDIAVLGGGPGGYPAAIRAAEMGKKVALIEQSELGGTCLNRGCIPSKALIAGGSFYHRLNRAKEFGLTIPSCSLDYSALAAHKDSVVKKMRGGLEGLIASHRITLIQGRGTFTSPFTLQVTGKEECLITADRIIIATGSEPKHLPNIPVDGKNIHDSTSLLALQKLPKSIIIIGAGVIGCEFASLYNHLGSQVWVVELLPRIISTEAEELSDALKKAFVKRGISVHTGVKVEKVVPDKNGVAVHIQGSAPLQSECCLVAIGRSLNTKNIGLEKIGLAPEQNGQIAVNDKMETAIKGVYAVGDIASKWQLAHVATHQGIIAAENAAGKSAKMSTRAIPNVIFTDPEIASVGLSLAEAKKLGHPASLSAFPYQALGKAEAMLHKEGFAQVVVDEKTGQIYGAQVVGYDASNLIAEMTVAIENELTIECIAETLHAHPTFSEVWGEAALLSTGFPLHIAPRKSL